MRMLEPREVKALFDKAFADVEHDIFYAIKTNANERDSLLAQLDVLSKLKERTDARLEYPDPLAD